MVVINGSTKLINSIFEFSSPFFPSSVPPLGVLVFPFPFFSANILIIYLQHASFNFILSFFKSM